MLCSGFVMRRGGVCIAGALVALLSAAVSTSVTSGLVGPLREDWLVVLPKAVACSLRPMSVRAAAVVLVHTRMLMYSRQTKLIIRGAGSRAGRSKHFPQAR